MQVKRKKDGHHFLQGGVTAFLMWISMTVVYQPLGAQFPLWMHQSVVWLLLKKALLFSH